MRKLTGQLRRRLKKLEAERRASNANESNGVDWFALTENRIDDFVASLPEFESNPIRDANVGEGKRLRERENQLVVEINNLIEQGKLDAEPIPTDLHPRPLAILTFDEIKFKYLEHLLTNKLEFSNKSEEDQQ